ncbi:hypothetical protein B0H12DRAFT_1229052 [Mycena haematopus]|nr:hypothetical protein B0H12DRAFT_1229052 [Mycena haematopus]
MPHCAAQSRLPASRVINAGSGSAPHPRAGGLELEEEALCASFVLWQDLPAHREPMHVVCTKYPTGLFLWSLLDLDFRIRAVFHVHVYALGVRTPLRHRRRPTIPEHQLALGLTRCGKRTTNAKPPPPPSGSDSDGHAYAHLVDGGKRGRRTLFVLDLAGSSKARRERLARGVAGSALVHGSHHVLTYIPLIPDVQPNTFSLDSLAPPNSTMMVPSRHRQIHDDIESSWNSSAKTSIRLSSPWRRLTACLRSVLFIPGSSSPRVVSATEYRVHPPHASSCWSTWVDLRASSIFPATATPSPVTLAGSPCAAPTPQTPFSVYTRRAVPIRGAHPHHLPLLKLPLPFASRGMRLASTSSFTPPSSFTSKSTSWRDGLQFASKHNPIPSSIRVARTRTTLQPPLAAVILPIFAEQRDDRALVKKIIVVLGFDADEDMQRITYLLRYGKLRKTNAAAVVRLRFDPPLGIGREPRHPAVQLSLGRLSCPSSQGAGAEVAPEGDAFWVALVSTHGVPVYV